MNQETEQQWQEQETPEQREQRIRRMAIVSIEGEIKDDRAEFNRLSGLPPDPKTAAKMEFLQQHIARLGKWLDCHVTNCTNGCTHRKARAT